MKKLPGQHGGQPPVVVRADSAYYNAKVAKAARDGGAELSVTVRMNKRIKTAIAGIDEHAWTKIQYNNSIYDEATKTWVSEACRRRVNNGHSATGGFYSTLQQWWGFTRLPVR